MEETWRVYQRRPGSEELLGHLLGSPCDLSAAENLLKERKNSRDDVTRAGFDYVERCQDACDEYYAEHPDQELYTHEETVCSELTAELPNVMKLLLEYGLDPNGACDGEYGEMSVMGCVTRVYDGYVAADTLALLMEHGGDPDLVIDGESLFQDIDFDVWFDAYNMPYKMVYDSKVHCWFVMLGSSGNSKNGRELVTVYAERRDESDLDDFRISDLKDHRNYTFAITRTPSRGESCALHIIDKRTFWEVAWF